MSITAFLGGGNAVTKAFGQTGTLSRDSQDHVKAAAAPCNHLRQIEYRNELPKGVTGKILRRALREEAKTND